MSDDPEPVTRLLRRIDDGDAAAAHELLPLVYDELHRLARKVFAVGRGRTLQATVLVHEAYLKLLGPGGDRKSWEGRRQFFAVAATAMRRMLSTYARDMHRLKRGGALRRVTISGLGIHGDDEGTQEGALDLIDLDAALAELEEASPRIARVVQLRFFSGMTVEEVAQELSVTERSVYKDWRTGRAFLRRRMSAGGDE